MPAYICFSIKEKNKQTKTTKKKNKNKKPLWVVEHIALHTEQRCPQVWQQAAASMPLSLITLSEHADLGKGRKRALVLLEGTAK